VANLTISVDDEVLKRARIRALQQDTSVNALLRDYLIAYGQAGSAVAALEEFAAIGRESGGSSGDAGRRWTRDELYADRLQ